MSALRSIAMAFSMFSILPMPRVEWKEENMRFLLAAFPLVGVLIGLCVLLWLWVCRELGVGTILSAAGLTLIPVALSGGIHLDGFCDTMDALKSRAAPEKKREILKDPHAGAFAVIGVCAFFLLYFALCTELAADQTTACLMALIPVMSRAAAGFAGIVYPPARGAGTLRRFHDSASRLAAVLLAGWFALCATALLLISPLCGAAMTAAALGCALFVFFLSKKQFGGMSGDIAGYQLELSELVMLLALVLMQKGVGA